MTDDLDIRIETGIEEEEIPKKRSATSIFQPISIIASAAKRVIIDTAIKKTVSAVKTSVQAIDDLANDNKPKSEEEYFIAKKYKEYFDKFEPKTLKCRLLTGKR